MAIAHDVTTTATAYTSTGTQTTSHVASGSARGAVVLIAQSASANDEVSGVTYGGVAMNRISSNSEATEAGRVYIYFLDGVLTGTRDVAMTTTASANKQLSVSTMTVTSGMGIKNVGAGGTGTSTSVANPSWTTTGLTSGVATQAYEVIHSGLQTMTNTPTGSWVLISSTDLGSVGRGFARLFTASSGTTLTAGWTAATADDYVGNSIVLVESVIGDVTSTFTAGLTGETRKDQTLAASTETTAGLTTTADVSTSSTNHEADSNLANTATLTSNATRNTTGESSTLLTAGLTAAFTLTALLAGVTATTAGLTADAVVASLVSATTETTAGLTADASHNQNMVANNASITVTLSTDASTGSLIATATPVTFASTADAVITAYADSNTPVSVDLTASAVILYAIEAETITTAGLTADTFQGQSIDSNLATTAGLTADVTHVTTTGADTTVTAGLTADVQHYQSIDADTAVTAGLTASASINSLVGANLVVALKSTFEFDALIVAGGGGGGYNNGGGGAGGLINQNNLEISPNTTLNVTLGLGGAGVNYVNSTGVNGGNSSLTGTGFTSLTAIGGGGGASFDNVGNGAGANGGSGGGGGGSDSFRILAGGTGTAGQGYAGGTGYGKPSTNTGGGGGGAGAVGGNAANNVTGPGGIGRDFSSWLTGNPFSLGDSGYFAGGGGGAANGDQGGAAGAAGGLGGGGDGRSSANGENGLAYTGGGGGAGGYLWLGGSGADGSIILRTNYAAGNNFQRTGYGGSWFNGDYVYTWFSSNGTVKGSSPTTLTAKTTRNTLVDNNTVVTAGLTAEARVTRYAGANLAVEFNPVIGSDGAGGGKIAYDAGSQQSWGRYLEVAPNGWNYDAENLIWNVGLGDYDGGGYYWTLSPQASSLANTIGSGLSNTDAIITADPSVSTASYISRNYNGGGQTDWFLPTQVELYEVYRNLRDYLVLPSGPYYWTSTATTDSHAFVQAINIANNGTYTGVPKASKYAVRAMRYSSTAGSASASVDRLIDSNATVTANLSGDVQLNTLLNANTYVSAGLDVDTVKDTALDSDLATTATLTADITKTQVLDADVIITTGLTADGFVTEQIDSATIITATLEADVSRDSNVESDFIVTSSQTATVIHDRIIEPLTTTVTVGLTGNAFLNTLLYAQSTLTAGLTADATVTRNSATQTSITAGLTADTQRATSSQSTTTVAVGLTAEAIKNMTVGASLGVAATLSTTARFSNPATDHDVLVEVVIPEEIWVVYLQENIWTAEQEAYDFERDSTNYTLGTSLWEVYI